MYSSYYGYDVSPYARSSTATSTAAASSAAGAVAVAAAGFLLVFYITIIALSILQLVALWRVFKKANRHGYEALIPGHNTYVMFELSGLCPALIFLLFVPIANIVVAFWMNIELAKAYGKGTGFGVGLTLLAPIFTCILGFGKSTYVGPATPNNTAAPAQSSAPSAPVAPVAPVQESTPVAPSAPVAPVQESTPVAPVEPEAPVVDNTQSNDNNQQ